MSEAQADLGVAALKPATRISERYVVVRLLGEGGMGQVYEVEHEAIGRHFALKLLNISPCSEELLRRFRREARALGRVTSPRVAQVTDFGFEPRLGPYYVMELLDGETLEDRLVREHYLPAAQAIPIGIDLCEALNEVHSAGIIHRDLKPSNVGLTRAGAFRVKLLDFGLATASDGAFFERITRSQEVVGSLPYMAPERFYNAELTHSVDLYALGVVLYEMLTGRLPYDGQSAAILINQHINGEPPPFASVAPELDLPPALEVIVNRLLDKDPAQRFATAAAVGRALHAATIDAPLPTLFDFDGSAGLASTLLADDTAGYPAYEAGERRTSPTASEPIPIPEAVGLGDPGLAPTVAATGDSEGPDTDPDLEQPETLQRPPSPGGASGDDRRQGIPTSVVPERAKPSTPASWTPDPSRADKPLASTVASTGSPAGPDGGWETEKVSSDASYPGFSPRRRGRRWLRAVIFALVALIGSSVVAAVTFYLVHEPPRRRPSERQSEPAKIAPLPPPPTPPDGVPSGPSSLAVPGLQIPSISSAPRASGVGVAADAVQETAAPPPRRPGQPRDAGNPASPSATGPIEHPGSVPPTPPVPPSIEVAPTKTPAAPPRPPTPPSVWRGGVIDQP